MRERLHHFIAQLIDALRQFSGELFIGGGERKFRARMDQIGHGLGLREIEPAIEKSAPREFAGLGQPRAIFQNRVEHEFRRQNAAMTGNLHGIFARERARRAQDGEQHFIHGFALPDDFAVMNCVRRRGGRFQRTFSDSVEKLCPRRPTPPRRKCARRPVRLRRAAWRWRRWCRQTWAEIVKVELDSASRARS